MRQFAQCVGLQQLEAAAVGIQQALPLHPAQLPAQGAAVAVQVVGQLRPGEGDAEGQLPGPLGLGQQIGRDLGPQAVQQKQVHPPRQQEIFVADGPHQVLQHQLPGGAAVGAEQPVVGDQQHLAGGAGGHGDRAGQAGAAQHIPKYPARPHPGDGQAAAVGGQPRRLDGPGQDDPHAVAGLAGPDQHRPPDIAAPHRPQPVQKPDQGLGAQPPEKGRGL